MAANCIRAGSVTACDGFPQSPWHPYHSYHNGKKKLFLVQIVNINLMLVMNGVVMINGVFNKDESSSRLGENLL